MPSAIVPWPWRNCCQPVLTAETGHIQVSQPDSNQGLVNRGLAIYVHWPFCLAKCPYCDFNSHVRENYAGLDQVAWSQALVSDLQHDLDRLNDNCGPATSLFFGGGTPSLMEGGTVARLIDAISDRIGFADNAEITLEANPTSVEAKRFRDYSAAGINRFSLGIQSLRDDDLATLGRQHSVAEALAALEVAKNHCDNISFDLIYARPDQTPEAWQQELNQALELEPAHLSLYQLTIERGTRFYEQWRTHDLVLPDEDLAADMFDLTNDLCADQGLDNYEISNYARPGFESRHNISYWQSDPYIGVGPGAHGRLNTAQCRLATTRLRSPEKWLEQTTRQSHGIGTEEKITGDILVAEVLMMGLRLKTGLSDQRFQALTGQTLRQALPGEALGELIEGGFVTFSDDILAVTPEGRSVLNTVTQKLLA